MNGQVIYSYGAQRNILTNNEKVARKIAKSLWRMRRYEPSTHNPTFAKPIEFLCNVGKHLISERTFYYFLLPQTSARELLFSVGFHDDNGNCGELWSAYSDGVLTYATWGSGVVNVDNMKLVDWDKAIEILRLPHGAPESANIGFALTAILEH